MVLAGGPSTLTLPENTETLIMSPRPPTLLRSVDIAQVSSALYMFNNKYFVRTADNKGNKRSENLILSTLNLITAHLLRTKDHPALHLMRHINNLSLSTDAGHVVNMAMHVMM